MSDSLFQLEWKGRSLGSHSVDQLRARLAADEISRLHRVQVQGVWRPLGEWLDQLENVQQANAAQAAEQARLQRGREGGSLRPPERLKKAETRDAPVPPAQPQPESFPAPSVPAPPSALAPHFTGFPPSSGLAIGSLVFGILNGVLFACAIVLFSEDIFRWVPLVCWALLISWVLAIVFGHLALLDIRRSESLRGRGLALAGLITAYTVIALISLRILFATLNDYERFLP